MMKVLRKKRKGGFTLIELIVVIAILGILIAIAVPRLGGFRESAQDRANEANAKLLTNIAQIIQADTGAFPTAVQWASPFTTMTVANATIGTRQYISEPVVWEGTGTGFTYDPATGIVLAP